MDILASICGNNVGSGILANLLTNLLVFTSAPVISMLVVWRRGCSGSSPPPTTPTVSDPAPVVAWPLFGSFLLYLLLQAIGMVVAVTQFDKTGLAWVYLFIATMAVNPPFLVASVSLPWIGSLTRRHLLDNNWKGSFAGGIVLNWLGNVFCFIAGGLAIAIILLIASLFSI